MAKKILLADDSITIQKVIELTFSDEDFDVITVGNGRLALERLPEVRPDIVLCDIIMPEKDGYEVCEQIKSSPASSHVPVLLLTGAFEPFDQERASRAGYDGSLAKPFEPETLIAKVKDLLARAPSRPVASPPVAAASPVPTVVPFARPAAAPPSTPLGTGFITDEPFPEAGEARPAASPPPPAGDTSVPPLAALSEEESATLSAPPAAEGAEDAASTVMFRPTDLSWSASEPSAPPVAARPEPPAPAPRISLPEPKGEPEPVLVPDMPAPIGPVTGDEPPVFEAVLEEDLDFGPAGFEPEPASEEVGGETLFAPEPTPVPSPDRPAEPPVAAPVEPTAPPVAEAASSIDDLLSAPPAAPPPAGEPAFVEESPLQDETEASAPPHSELPAETASFEPTYVDAPQAEPVPAAAPEPPPLPTPSPEPAPVPEAAPSPRSPVLPEPQPESIPTPVPPPVAASPGAVPPVDAEPSAAGPLADLELPAEEAPAAAASQAAAFSVPVDMVEKIAQRVVAQVSEKVVREIAWEVIPDLAEALIKQEIERLKAELQKT